MGSWWKNWQRDRSQIPEVVIPLADAPNTTPQTEKDAESNVNSLDSQEKGAASAPESTTLTLEALRAEVDSAVSASGHNSVYDRMFLLPRNGRSSTPKEPAILSLPARTPSYHFTEGSGCLTG